MGRYTWLMLDAGKTQEPAQPVNMTFAAAAAARSSHWASPGASREVPHSGEGGGCAAPEDEPPTDAVDEVELIWKKAVAARTLQLTAEQPATAAPRAPASPKPDPLHSQPPSRSHNALPRNSALGRADGDHVSVTSSLPPALSFSPSAGDLASVLASRRRLQGTYPAVPPAGAMPPPGPLPDLSIPGQSTSGGSGGGGRGGVGGGGPPRAHPFTAPGVALDSDSEGEGGGGGGGGGEDGGRLRPGRQRSRSFSQLPLVGGGGGGVRGAAAGASGDDALSDDGELADDDCAEPGATEPGLMPADAAAAAAAAVATFGLRDSTRVAGARAGGATTAALVRALSTKNALACSGPGGGVGGVGGGGGLVAALLSSSGAANGGGGAGLGGLGLAGFARGLFGGGAGAASGGAGGGGGAEVPSSVSDGYDAGWSAGGGGGNEGEGEGGGDGEGEGRDGGCLVLPVLRTLLDMQQQSGQVAAALALSAARGKGGAAAKPNSHGGPSASATAISRQASQLLRASASPNRLMSAQSPNGLARQGSSSLVAPGGGGGGVAPPGRRTGSGGAMPDGLRSSPSRTMLMSAMRPSPLALPRSGGAGAGAADDDGAAEVVGGGADDGLDVDTAAAAAAVPGSSGGAAASPRVRLPPGRTKSYGPGMLPSPAAALPVGSPQGGGFRGSPIPRTSGGGGSGGGVGVGGGGLHSPGGPRASTSTGLLPPAATASPRSLTAGVGMGLGLAGSSSPGASPLGSAAAAAAAAVGLGGAGGGGGLPSPSAAGAKGSPRGSRFSWANKLAGRGAIRVARRQRHHQRRCVPGPAVACRRRGGSRSHCTGWRWRRRHWRRQCRHVRHRRRIRPLSQPRARARHDLLR